MLKTDFILFLLAMALHSRISAQDVSTHTWKDRVLMVMVSDTSNVQLSKQIQQLQKNLKGLQERKLVLYQTTPKYFRKGWGTGNKWISGNSLYKKYVQATDFEIVLVGLDGGVKHRSSRILETSQLFDIIDAMPMRRSEMRN